VNPGLQLVAGKHGPPGGPEKPTLQVQTELALTASELAAHDRQVPASVAPTAAEYLPASQATQPPLPLALLYVPAAHAMQPAHPVTCNSANLSILDGPYNEMIRYWPTSGVGHVTSSW